MTPTVCAVIVTHRRPDQLAKSLDAVTSQGLRPDQLVVVDNDDDARVADLVAGQPIPSTYLGSRRNLGGAGIIARPALCAGQGGDCLFGLAATRQAIRSTRRPRRVRGESASALTQEPADAAGTPRLL